MGQYYYKIHCAHLLIFFTFYKENEKKEENARGSLKIEGVYHKVEWHFVYVHCV